MELSKYIRWLYIGLVTLGVVATIAGGFGYVWFSEQNGDHDYTVKLEQVEDASRVEEAETVHASNLSDKQYNVLHEAFKQQDHFFGSSSVVVETLQRYDTFDGWTVVEVGDGVFILASVQYDGYTSPAYKRIAGTLGMIMLSVPLVLLWVVLLEPAIP